MASSNPPQGPSHSPSQSQDRPNRPAQYNTLLTYTSLGALLLCPALIALPPRKLDVYTVLLLSGTALGGNHLLHAYTGRGLADRVPALAGMGATRGGHASERGGRAAVDGARGADGGTAGTTTMTTMAAAAAMAGAPVAKTLRQVDGAEGARRQRGGGEQEQEKQTLRQRKSDWKVQREEREKEALEDGRGYGGLIADQIWEVWNWGGKNGEEGEGQEKGGKK